MGAGRALSGRLLVIEDVRLFDPSSLKVLGLWGQRVGSQRAFRAIASMWPAKGRANATLERWLATLERRGRLRFIPLPALNETDTLRLVRVLSPGGRGGALFARRLFETAEGNPLFVLETLKSLLESGELREEGRNWHTRFDEATAASRGARAEPDPGSNALVTPLGLG